MIERKIGVALAGLRAYLVTAGTPNCFWPFAGHCFSFNYCIKSGAYDLVHGTPEFLTFIYGQLVFFKPAKTIVVQAKTDHPLRPGIFLDYYTGTDEKFTGQYIVADLEDFANKNLHHRIGPGHFNLHLHRTEVVRPPVRACDPIFPLVLKYCKCNFTFEGLEAKNASTDGTPIQSYGDLRPTHDADMDKGTAEKLSLDSP